MPINCVDVFQVLLSFAKIVSAPHPSSVEGDIKYLFRKWGIDAYKCVIAAIQCNPALSKVEKPALVELVKTWFDDGVAASMFNAKALEAYEGFDVQQVNASGAKEASKPARVGFWGRKK